MSDRGLRRPTTWPLIGRLEELELITSTMEASAIHGVVIAGAAGVGKSRLASEALAALAGKGWGTKRAVATRAAAEIPFGPVAHLLGSSHGMGPLEILRRAGSDMAKEAGDGKLAFFVDDAHLLDGRSAALVHQLAVSRAATVLVTVRAGDIAPEPVTALWKDGLAVRIELQPLSPTEVRELVTLVLGSAVDGLTLHDLVSLSRGNVLYLHELVLSGLASGVLVREEGLWRWRGPLVTGFGLRELIEGRLARLAPEARCLLEMLALGEPLDLALLEKLGSRGALEGADSMGLLSTAQLSGRTQVRLSHPLYAEVLRAATSPIRRLRALQQLARSVEPTAGRRSDDLLRRATLLIEAGRAIPAADLAAAADRALALGDPRLAERLARPAWDQEGRFAAGLALARSLIDQRQVEEADRVMIAMAPSTESDVAQLGSTRACNLAYGMGQLDRSMALLHQTEGAVHDRSFRDDVAATRSLVSYARGELAEASEVARSIIHRRLAHFTGLLRASNTVACALAFSGRPETALGELERALGTLRRAGNGFEQAENKVLALRTQALWLAGRLGEADALARERYAATLTARRDPVRGYWATICGEYALFQGRIQTSVNMLREALAVLRDFDPYHMQLGCLATLAQAAALAGNLETAEQALDAIARGRPKLPAEEGWIMLGHAWLLASRGELTSARLAAREAAAAYRGVSQLGLEAIAWHDLARLGDAAGAPRLGEIAQSAEGSLIPYLAAHASALRSRQGVGLDEASCRLEQLGMTLLAAEAACEAALAHQREGSSSASRAARARARYLTACCEGASSPALQLPDLPDPLTPREREIAALAARGLTSAAIARRLFVSVRTVDNHLQQIYSKLDVHNRQQLAPVLGSGEGPSLPVTLACS
jgi:DNA-binding CsgD family transcriptional regulator